MSDEKLDKIYAKLLELEQTLARMESRQGEFKQHIAQEPVVGSFASQSQK